MPKASNNPNNLMIFNKINKLSLQTFNYIYKNIFAGSLTVLLGSCAIALTKISYNLGLLNFIGALLEKTIFFGSMYSVLMAPIYKILENFKKYPDIEFSDSNNFNLKFNKNYYDIILPCLKTVLLFKTISAIFYPYNFLMDFFVLNLYYNPIMLAITEAAKVAILFCTLDLLIDGLFSGVKHSVYNFNVFLDIIHKNINNQALNSDDIKSLKQILNITALGLISLFTINFSLFNPFITNNILLLTLNLTGAAIISFFSGHIALNTINHISGFLYNNFFNVYKLNSQNEIILNKQNVIGQIITNTGDLMNYAYKEVFSNISSENKYDAKAVRELRNNRFRFSK